MTSKKGPPSVQPLGKPTVVSGSTRTKALVFISHDTRDAEIAEAFANLLQDASGGVLRSFRSSDRKGTSGIEFGAEWYAAIMEKLKDATDVVALLTPQSLGRPWLLYEAGVAKGRLDTVVFGVALGVPLENVGVGPFAQFQNSGDDEDSLTKLVLQLIRRNPDAEPREEAVRRQVMAFREAFFRLLADGPVKTVSQPTPEMDASAVARLFEEVKVMFRQLPDQIEMSLERRLRHTRPVLAPRIELTSRTVSDLYRTFDESIPGDRGVGWSQLLRLSGAFMPGLQALVIEMRDAWRHGDLERIDGLRTRILGQLPTSLELLTEIDAEKREYLYDLIPMLTNYLGSIALKRWKGLKPKRNVPGTSTAPPEAG